MYRFVLCCLVLFVLCNADLDLLLRSVCVRRCQGKLKVDDEKVCNEFCGFVNHLPQHQHLEKINKSLEKLGSDLLVEGCVLLLFSLSHSLS